MDLEANNSPSLTLMSSSSGSPLEQSDSEEFPVWPGVETGGLSDVFAVSPANSVFVSVTLV